MCRYASAIENYVATQKEEIAKEAEGKGLDELFPTPGQNEDICAGNRDYLSSPCPLGWRHVLHNGDSSTTESVKCLAPDWYSGTCQRWRVFERSDREKDAVTCGVRFPCKSARCPGVEIRGAANAKEALPDFFTPGCPLGWIETGSHFPLSASVSASSSSDPTTVREREGICKAPPAYEGPCKGSFAIGGSDKVQDREIFSLLCGVAFPCFLDPTYSRSFTGAFLDESEYRKIEVKESDASQETTPAFSQTPLIPWDRALGPCRQDLHTAILCPISYRLDPVLSLCNFDSPTKLEGSFVPTPECRTLPAEAVPAERLSMRSRCSVSFPCDAPTPSEEICIPDFERCPKNALITSADEIECFLPITSNAEDQGLSTQPDAGSDLERIERPIPRPCPTYVNLSSISKSYYAHLFTL